MDVKLTLKVAIPEELIEAFGITDDTLFECYVKDGEIIINLINENGGDSK